MAKNNIKITANVADTVRPTVRRRRPATRLARAADHSRAGSPRRCCPTTT